MADPKEIDFTLPGGLRVRTMDIMLDNEVMILDRDGEMITRFNARRGEWTPGSGDLGDSTQLVLSHNIAAQIARRLAKERG